MMTRLAMMAGLCGLCLCVPVAVSAQVDRANLSGSVVDPSGAVVPGATVRLVSSATGFTREARSSESGEYRLVALPAGSYLLTVVTDGFPALVVENLQLGVGQNRTLDVALALGGVATEVRVTASAVALDRTSAEIGSVISGEQLSSVPLNGRNWASLMMLAPGATNTGEGGQGSIRFFGRARDDNNWTFDGVDATGIKDPRQEASLRLVMSTEAIAEFRVSATGYTADAGTGAGAQVNLVSKTGSNRFTGAAFNYFRDEALDSRRVLDRLPDEPAFRLFQYGASLGGPLVEGRTFFFGSYEGLRQTLDVANERPALVPSASFRATAAATPALAAVLTAYPRGTRATSNPDVDEYVGRRQLSWDEDSFLFRVDHRLDDATQIFARANGVKGVIDSEVRSDLLETRRSESSPFNLTGQVQRVLPRSSLVEFKFGWNRSPLERLDAGLGAEGYEIQRAFTPTRATLFSEEKPQSFSYLANLVKVAGRHTVKVGGEFRRVHVDVATSAATSVRWGSTAAFLANQTNRIRIDGELPLQKARRWYGIGFAQTEWRAAESLTVNAGLRYEYYSVMTEASGNGNVLDLQACPPTATSIYCAPGTPWYSPDKNNVAPRLGVAWTPSARWVVRGGYGIYYSPGQNDDVTAAIDSLALRGELTTPGSYPVAPVASQVLSRANSRPRALQRNREDMQSQIYSVTVQRDLGLGFVSQVGFVGSRASHVFNRLFVNTIDTATGARPAAPFLTTQIDRKGNLGETRYKSMLVTLQRAFTGGFLAQASYTLGESRDNNAGNGEGSEWQDARCGDCEWGPSDFDARHVLSLNAVWDLPFGRDRRVATSGLAAAILGDWNLSTVLMARSGRPINVTIERIGADGNDINQRPNAVAGVEAVTGNTSNWLNLAAFSAPAAGTFGDAPRNGIRGPGAWQLDLSLAKRVRLGGTRGLQLRVDAFNVFDIDQFGNPARVVSQPLIFGVLSPLNSGPTGTGTARQFQLGLRVDF